MWQKAIRLIDAKPELLSSNGQIIVQINPIEWEDLELDNFEIFDSRKYGDTLLVFFEKSS
jgi:16S rRNA G966 N2-methylase RsmD